MTAVAFHFNAPDKRAYACRLLRKAFLKGARLVVLAGAGRDVGLAQALWTLSPTDFVPHCRESDSHQTQSRSPIFIAGAALPADFQADVLLNLTDAVAVGYDRFARVIEVVEQDEGDRTQARQRWRQYQADGVTPERHDLKAPGSAG